MIYFSIQFSVSSFQFSVFLTAKFDAVRKTENWKLETGN
jgi:hypothetical protein